MLKKSLVSLLLCAGLASSVGAQEELKADMGKMAADLSAVQIGFFSNDKKGTLTSLMDLKKIVYKSIGDKDTITKLLPEDIRYKASIAINSAELINRQIEKIEAILKDKNMRMINRQMKSQQAFLEIQQQCFRCHNLVRDWQ
ncbi:MAG: hypothetical protein U9Q40_04145 [Campylobacterota bacterium]|nr:hypothetical protein [Campylobacterota bacterium]